MTDFFGGIQVGFESPEELNRADAFLDGLRVDAEAAVSLAGERFESPGEPLELATATLVLLECGGDNEVKPILDRLKEGDPEVCDAIRRGLRLSKVGRIQKSAHLCRQNDRTKGFGTKKLPEAYVNLHGTLSNTLGLNPDKFVVSQCGGLRKLDRCFS